MNKGITLIETLVAVLVMGVLSVIAYSSYKNSHIQTNREIAEQVLMQNVYNMSKFYSQNGKYTTSSNSWPNVISATVTGTTGPAYTIGFSQTTASSTNYALIAYPVPGSVQANDGNICINQYGVITYPVVNNQDCITTTASTVSTIPAGPCSTPAANQCPNASDPQGNTCQGGTWYYCTGNCDRAVICGTGGLGCYNNCHDTVIYDATCNGHCDRAHFIVPMSMQGQTLCTDSAGQCGTTTVTYY